MTWMRNAGVFILFLVVLTIVIANLPECESEAHAQKKTSMEKKAADVLDGKTGDGELVPMVAQPGELDVEELEEKWAPPPEPQEDKLVTAIPFVVILVVAAGCAIFVIIWILRLLSRRGAGSGADGKPARDPNSAQCPYCKKNKDVRSFYNAPRITLPRRVFNFGAIQIILPEKEESQAIRICDTCYEFSVSYKRLKEEELMTMRARDREREFKERIEAQKNMAEKIKELQNGSAS